ncbi:MAG: RNA 2'-phosphotransferase, partial [Bacteroidota bacterium]
MSLLLRHQPELGGLQLDEQGWTSVSDLLAHLQTKDPSIDRFRLEEIVATNNKKRFAFHPEEVNLIRAQQGHSVDVELAYRPVDPP